MNDQLKLGKLLNLSDRIGNEARQFSILSLGYSGSLDIQEGIFQMLGVYYSNM